ncbi:hypothetical protein [Methanoplanus endosymbiosus]|uniref:Lipoprotein n=1 Tax=Methanoplanus endosymbiosus TaxID=33865 RepID=A0A9E7TJ98_9EURY|nr:hypothetical protein [Methanoplanus endosymbiosus]UUX91530.1 hypothetical protein L6E24_09120 [Methanoplanus endosymbiosus]
MNSGFKTLILILVLFLVAVLAAGCSETASQPVPATPVPTAVSTPQATVEVPTVQEPEWTVWREGSNTLNPLGGYFTYTPSAFGQRFDKLKVEVKANHPITVLFLNDANLAAFNYKMDTNTGEYEAIARYDDVNYKVIEQFSDEPLNVVLWNQGNQLVTADVNIWYAV